MFWFLLLFLIIGTLGYLRLPLQKGNIPIIAWLVLVPILGSLSGWMWLLWLPALLVFTLINLPQLRQKLISKPAMALITKNLPPVSKTEQEALDSGDVWWDAEIFSGKPNWNRLYGLASSSLTAEEQAFLDGPTEQLCHMIDDWQISHELLDLPQELWDFIKQERFWGMIIPEEYGGLGFSALAHSEVIMKISSRSTSVAVTVMVPNSLGPGQLLLEYGSEEEKAHFLPRLATGKEIPCFALTGPEAGSDASSIPDMGIVCRAEFEGKADVLGIRLNWEKRYITLAPIATILGLAFHLFDPEHLLGNEEDIGVTVALIPTDTTGIQIGRRHFPLNSPFQNGPTIGEDVFIPMDWIVGGQEQVGHGWQMLVECLGEGRGISLPALSTGAAKMASRVTGAYSRVRKQFGMPIGKFEGVEEPLARILGNTYIMDAGRKLTLAALDQGHRPAVITALLKYQLTERMRRVINDAMDIQGGSGICLGPSNYMGRGYQALPVAITVEGANILTRTLIVFGQGAIRCHPYLLTEMETAQAKDINKFDQALFGHIGFIISNLTRSIWFGLTNGIFEACGTPATRCYCRHLTRLCANFALITDYALLTLGGGFKRKERLSGRLADILSNLYLCSAVLKNYEEQGVPKADKALVDYAAKLTIHRAQQAMLAAFHNLPFPWLATTLRFFMFPFGKPYSPPHDELIHEVAKLALEPSATRDRLTEGIYRSEDPEHQIGRIEYAMLQTIRAADAEKKLHGLKKAGDIKGLTQELLTEDALAKGLVTDTEAQLLLNSWQAMRNAVQVDSFTPEELLGSK
ncbi:MAG TPA: acyl-CoA dehydrogenase [Thiothrix sp.]|nr:acyl-CoA dehydrogenase [Thiothrix sp.]